MTSATSRPFLGPARLLSGLFLLAAVVAAPVNGQGLYRYRDANGHWVFSDRQPVEAPFELLELEREGRPVGVRLYQRDGQNGIRVLAAENTFHGTVQVAFNVLGAINLTPDVPTRGNRILAPRSDTMLFELLPATAGEPSRIELEYQFIHGDPRARHRPESPYRLPYAQASHYRVSQAWPDAVTHNDPANADAIDFEMPIGTNVFAARDGIVIEVASDFFEAGMEESFSDQANMIRVLHADGTMALYGHLNWNSIRVRPGQEVGRGEYIADSGNTGFSSGPHLHFVVQRNTGGAVNSVPVEFAGPGGEPLRVATGDRPVAY